MRRKKSETDVTKQVLAKETEGVIDLDPTDQTTTPAERKVGAQMLRDAGVEIAGLERPLPAESTAPAQPAKRKYTKRAKKTAGVVVTPTFVDRDAIRTARIQVFIEYVDGNRSFESAAAKDQSLLTLDTMAQQLLSTEK